jgi:hypothetical protein
MAAACNIAGRDIIFTLYCQRKNKIFNALLTICVLWALLLPAGAQVYKWVDEKGTTHYGERPPQGKKAQEMEQRLANPGPAPGNAAQPNWKDKDLEFRGRRIDAGQAEAKQKQQEGANREACNQARDQLVQMKAARRLYRLDETGERVYQSGDEHQASVAQLERLVSERCR